MQAIFDKLFLGNGVIESDAQDPVSWVYFNGQKAVEVASLEIDVQSSFFFFFFSEEKGLGGNTVVDMLAKLDINMENLFLGSSL